jgi:hypothetical protein
MKILLLKSTAAIGERHDHLLLYRRGTRRPTGRPQDFLAKSGVQPHYDRCKTAVENPFSTWKSK